MIQVLKRDGSRVGFTLSKINDVIMKAFTATHMKYNDDIVDLLALRVTALSCHFSPPSKLVSSPFL